LTDDARVVLSELMSNGVLHAGTELQVVICPGGNGGLRIEVSDASPVPVLPPLQPPPSSCDGAPRNEPLEQRYASPAATGRGLAMVSALASTWGWFPDPAGGKVVWAELGTAEAEEVGAGSVFSERPPYAVRPVRLIGVPVRLLKGSEDHFDDLFRELQMVGLAVPARGPGPSGGGAKGAPAGPVTAELVGLAEQVKSRLARVREPAKRVLRDAARRGERLMDLTLLADAGVPAALEMLEQLLKRSGEAARAGFLLTEPPAAEIVVWRRWLRRELEGQIDGKPPRACPFPVVPVRGGPGRPAPCRPAPCRPAPGSPGTLGGETLSHVRGVLGGAGTAGGDARAPAGPARDEGMAGVLERAAAYLGARRSTLCLLAEDNETVDCEVSVGSSPAVRVLCRPCTVSADSPCLEAVRTGRPVFLGSVAELYERYPVGLPAPVKSEPALACLPLVAPSGGAALGCLVVGFGEARDFAHPDRAFLGQLAAELAGSIVQQRERESRAVATERERALRDACEAVGRATSEAEVVREVVGAVVVEVAEWASAHLVGQDGAALYALARHRDPERESAAARLLEKRRRTAPGHGIVAECAKSGKPLVVQVVPDEAILAGAHDDEDVALLRKLKIGSVAASPLFGGGRLVGVLGFGNSVGRFISRDDLDAVGLLADKAGEVLGHFGRGSGKYVRTGQGD
jgi:GAF domain-containing protein